MEKISQDEREKIYKYVKGNSSIYSYVNNQAGYEKNNIPFLPWCFSPFFSSFWRPLPSKPALGSYPNNWCSRLSSWPSATSTRPLLVLTIPCTLWPSTWTSFSIALLQCIPPPRPTPYQSLATPPLFLHKSSSPHHRMRTLSVPCSNSLRRIQC